MTRIPTLGEIWAAIRADIRRAALLRTNGHTAKSHAYAKADTLYWSRLDYRVCRYLWRRDYLPASKHIPLASVISLAEEGLDGDDVITWGLLSILPTLATTLTSELAPAQRLRLVAGIERSMSRALPPIRHGEHDCAAIAALSLAAVDQVRHEIYGIGGGTAACGTAAEYLSRFERHLREIDSSWTPGAPLMMTSFKEDSRPADAIVVSPIHQVELNRMLWRAMAAMQESARAVVTEFTVDSERLLNRAFLLAMSAWQTARLCRMGQEKWAAATTSRREPRIRELIEHELKALRGAAQAAQDAGEVLLSAGLQHLLLRLIPNELSTKAPFDSYGNSLSSAVRQAGLEVDDRFQRSREVNKRAQSRSVHSWTDSSWPGSRLWGARIARDQQNGLWGEIVTKYGRGYRPLKRVGQDAAEGSLTDSGLMLNAFRLYLRYGFIQESASLLEVEHFEAGRSELLQFAHSVKRALQIMPFGFDLTVLQQWHRILRRRWSELGHEEGVDVDETLTIHEVLLGRAASIVIAAGPTGARLFAERYYGGQSTPERLREIFDRSFESHRKGPATSTSARIESFLTGLKQSSLGAPVFVSVVDLGDSCSILGVAAGNRWCYELIDSTEQLTNTYSDELRTDLAFRLQATSDTWIRHSGTNRTLRIPWGESLTRVAAAILRIAATLDPSAKWIMLAIEPDLAGLPWQDIFLRASARQIIVSIVPSATWATLGARRATSGAASMIELSDASELEPLRRQIQSDEARWQGGEDQSIACVLGHGVRFKDFTSVRISQRDLVLSDWLEIATRRVVVAHSCFGGQVSEKFSGDLGGLPGPALAMGCRIFCAPVTAVPITTASVLHKYLFHAKGAPDIGSRYLAAIAEDPAVALYNLYGLASETI